MMEQLPEIVDISQIIQLLAENNATLADIQKTIWYLLETQAQTAKQLAALQQLNGG